MDATILDKVDVLIPLDSVGGTIWDYGFRGEILYIPITDFGTLPKAIEREKVTQVVRLIRQGRKVAIFCLGGHGRTGYFASLVLSELGVKDPIELMRRLYCKHAVETNEQLEAIAKFSGNKELLSKYRIDEQYSLEEIYKKYGICSNTKQVNDITCDICLNYKDKWGISYGQCEHGGKIKTVYSKSPSCENFK